MTIKYNYIVISDERDEIEVFVKHKKPAYYVYNKKSHEKLGYIYYHPQWRQYVFQQAIPNAIFSKSCLNDIVDFIESYTK